MVNSYRKANTRLRKMGRPELNGVTSSRLKMRPEIEQEIEKVILRCGFRRVTSDVITKECNDAKAKRNGSEGNDAVTSWNRSLCLYERVSEEVLVCEALFLTEQNMIARCNKL